MSKRRLMMASLMLQVITGQLAFTTFDQKVPRAVIQMGLEGDSMRAPFLMVRMVVRQLRARELWLKAVVACLGKRVAPL